MKQHVYVGMSGGVDSSVTAALLKQQGYRVTGVFMKNWTRDVLGFVCPWRQDLTDAQSVAAKLDIPLKVFDFEKDYKQKVVDYMIAEFKAGHTPNPDVMCNQEIKFKLFLDAALADGADLIATGHYARLEGGTLKTALDRGKEQSYFLYRVTEQALSKTLFPLGELTKVEVRQLAKQFGLPTAEKPDSQGICFIGEVSVKEFLGQYIRSQPGPIKTLDGKEVGQHDGAVFYTIGQRHGLGSGRLPAHLSLSLRARPSESKTGRQGGKPYYVVGKDMKTNTVFVTDDVAHATLHKDQFEIIDAHWINEKPDPSKSYQFRSRYRGPLIDGKLKASNGRYHIKLTEPERAITPGQSAVVYDGERVLGGGIISLM